MISYMRHETARISVIAGPRAIKRLKRVSAYPLCFCLAAGQMPPRVRRIRSCADSKCRPRFLPGNAREVLSVSPSLLDSAGGRAGGWEGEGRGGGGGGGGASEDPSVCGGDIDSEAKQKTPTIIDRHKRSRRGKKGGDGGEGGGCRPRRSLK
jgi:hypothetical protein